MFVICLEGCHGSGKTELCRQLHELYGFEILDEGFLDQPSYALHPQSLVMETYWIAHWFQRLLKKQSELGLRDDIEFEESSEGDDADVSFSSITSSLSSSDESESELDRWEKHRQRVFIADRSPFSAVFYAPNGSLLEPVIRQQMVELMEQAGIHIITVNLQVEKELLWKRILARLEREPDRKKYHEDSYEWMETVRSFYDSFRWDFDIPNNNNSIEDVISSLLRTLSENIPSFHAVPPRLDAAFSQSKTVSPVHS